MNIDLNSFANFISISFINTLDFSEITCIVFFICSNSVLTSSIFVSLIKLNKSSVVFISSLKDSSISSNIGDILPISINLVFQFSPPFC